MQNNKYEYLTFILSNMDVTDINLRWIPKPVYTTKGNAIVTNDGHVFICKNPSTTFRILKLRNISYVIEYSLH